LQRALFQYPMGGPFALVIRQVAGRAVPDLHREIEAFLRLAAIGAGLSQKPDISGDLRAAKKAIGG
jgi:hypothetical protein